MYGRRESVKLLDILPDKTLEKTDHIHTLVLNGKKIDLLAKKELSPEEIRNIELGIISLKTGVTLPPEKARLKYAAYGWFQNGEERIPHNESDENESPYGYKTTYFYQGHATPPEKIPGSGTATYSGTASFHVATFSGGTRNITFSEQSNPASFTVDFANKKLHGDLGEIKTPAGVDTFAEIYNIQKLQFAADISGNRFKDDGKTPVRADGAFFGPNAEELAGKFTNNQRKNINGYIGYDKGFQDAGVFGATKNQ